MAEFSITFHYPTQDQADQAAKAYQRFADTRPAAPPAAAKDNLVAAPPPTMDGMALQDELAKLGFAQDLLAGLTAVQMKAILAGFATAKMKHSEARAKAQQASLVAQYSERAFGFTRQQQADLAVAFAADPQHTSAYRFLGRPANLKPLPGLAADDRARVREFAERNAASLAACGSTVPKFCETFDRVRATRRDYTADEYLGTK
jgi:hypothetical protein